MSRSLPSNHPLLLALCLLLLTFFRRAAADVNITWVIGTFYSDTVRAGDKATWIWADGNPHAVQGVDAASAALLPPGPGTDNRTVAKQNFTVTVTFPSPGYFQFQDPTFPFFTQADITVVPVVVSFGGATIPWFLGVTYAAASAIIQQGDTVTWVWKDDLPHGLKCPDNLPTFSGHGTNADLAVGDDFKYKKTFNTPGTYLYICQNHGEQMHGNITVLPKSGSKSPPVSGNKSPPVSPSPSPSGGKTPPPKGGGGNSTTKPPPKKLSPPTKKPPPKKLSPPTKKPPPKKLTPPTPSPSAPKKSPPKNPPPPPSKNTPPPPTKSPTAPPPKKTLPPSKSPTSPPTKKFPPPPKSTAPTPSKSATPPATKKSSFPPTPK